MNKYRENLFESYFDSIFGKSNVFSEKARRARTDNYELNYGKFLPKNKDAKILDIGSGAGNFLYFLKNKGYKNFMGIDISPQQVDFCKKNVSEHVEVANAFEFLKDKEIFYDVIVANDLLEHIVKEKTIAFLRMVNKTLKNKGVLLIKTPNMGNPFGISSRYRDFTHEIGFTEKSLYQVLYIAGFRNIQVVGAIAKDKWIFRILKKIIYFSLKKLYWYQGFVAQEILNSNLIAVAKK